MEKGACSIRGCCMSDGIRNKCGCERSWRANGRLMNKCEGPQWKRNSGRKWSRLHNTGPRGPFITMDSVCECESVTVRSALHA